MGFSEKAQLGEGGFDSSPSSSSSSDASNNKKWVIAGITLRAPLKPIHTAEKSSGGGHYDDETEECLTTPTGEESRIPPIATCPPAPRKPKPPPGSGFKCKYRRGMNKFFTPPDLDTVFIRPERAS